MLALLLGHPGHPYTTPAIWRQYDICRQFPAVANQPQDWPRRRAGLMWGGYGRPTIYLPAKIVQRKARLK